ncbi:hypothetical protein ACJJTC_009486 [Scirpophaga incertulas]
MSRGASHTGAKDDGPHSRDRCAISATVTKQPAPRIGPQGSYLKQRHKGTIKIMFNGGKELSYRLRGGPASREESEGASHRGRQHEVQNNTLPQRQWRLVRNSCCCVGKRYAQQIDISLLG